MFDFFFDIDWWSLALPFGYIFVLVSALYTFSTIYRKRKACMLSLELLDELPALPCVSYRTGAWSPDRAPPCLPLHRTPMKDS
jgi:hypothetical protein